MTVVLIAGLLVSGCGLCHSTPADAGDICSGPIILAVDDASVQFELFNFATIPEPGNIFLLVTLTLTNVTEPTVLPVGYPLFGLSTATELVYMSSPFSANLDSACPSDVGVASGGSATCQVVFEIPATKVPLSLRYVTPAGRALEAPITVTALCDRYAPYFDTTNIPCLGCTFPSCDPEINAVDTATADGVCSQSCAQCPSSSNACEACPVECGGAASACSVLIGTLVTCMMSNCAAECE